MWGIDMKFTNFSKRAFKPLLLCALTICLSIFVSFGAHAQTSPLNPLATSQDGRGDVLSADGGGGPLPAITNPLAPLTPPTVPNAAQITSGINSGLFLQNLQGVAGSAALIASITDMFDNLPDALLPLFLDSLLKSDLLPSEVTDLSHNLTLKTFFLLQDQVGLTFQLILALIQWDLQIKPLVDCRVLYVLAAVQGLAVCFQMLACQYPVIIQTASHLLVVLRLCKRVIVHPTGNLDVLIGLQL